MSLVSVITPAYNAALYIEETIKSVLAQTYENWEMVIVDDCSNDRTVQIVERYCVQDPRIRLVRHEKNQGVAAARNTALAAAKGRYVAFLDSDDMWYPQKLEKQLQFMEANDCAFSYTGYRKYITETGKQGKVIRVPDKMTYNAVFFNTAIACLTVMVDREQTGPFEMPLLKHAEDQCTWQSILKRGFVARGLHECLSLYRISSTSLTADKGKAARQQWDMYRQYHGMSVLKSAVCFASYAIHAVIKHL